jgi:hypothetical protein
MVAAIQKPPGAGGAESQIYFFNGKGKTWQIECRSTSAAGRAKIRAACRKALDSIRLS